MEIKSADMGRHSTLFLEELPWPISILKCNQQVAALSPGDELRAKVKDKDTVDNLVLLLRATKACEFTIRATKDGFVLNIKKH
jgi:TusA-related sulfurtransferase